jgi:hypothetical protein
MLNIPLQPTVLALMVLAEHKPPEAVRAPTKFAEIRFRALQDLHFRVAMVLQILEENKTTAPVAVGEAMDILAAVAEAATTDVLA